MVTLYLTFLRSAKMFSKAVAPFYSPITVCEGSSVSPSWPTLAVVCLFDDSHPRWCEVEFVVLMCIFPMTD